MVNICLIVIFDAKVVDNKCECNWECFMVPKAGGINALMVPKWCQFEAEMFVC
jgi:hypothetical protein